jgi:hypothetical protein
MECRWSSILHLLRDPGVDRYKLRVELRQDVKLRDVSPTAVATASEVGLVIGHTRAQAGDSRTVHGVVLFGFTERDPPGQPNADPDRRVALAQMAILEFPLRPSHSSHYAAAEIPLGPSAPGERPWRLLEVEVTPNGIVARHDGRSASWSEADLNSHWPDRERPLKIGPPGAGVIPRWVPRVPIGIWIRNSRVSVRTFTIEPLS